MKKIITALFFVGLAVVLFPITQTSNCGGNSAALAATRQIAMSCFVSLHKGEKNETLRIEDWLADPDNRAVLEFGWGVRSFWIKNEIKTEEELPIAVCGQIFSNVPQPTLWNLFKKNPGFAASYIDGSSRILKIEEFNDFDFTGYTYINESNFEPDAGGNG